MTINIQAWERLSSQGFGAIKAVSQSVVNMANKVDAWATRAVEGVLERIAPPPSSLSPEAGRTRGPAKKDVSVGLSAPDAEVSA